MYNIEFSNQAAKFLKKCDKIIGKRLFNEIESLKEDPFPSKTVRVVNEEGIFRTRVGDYRILYQVNYETNIILISKIDKRARVYDN